jgi:biopolymer transport protein TolR
MKPLSPLQKRAERRNRNQSMVDMNLVSLIDVFTILIFFLMSNVGVETISPSRAVQLPESMSQKPPKETVMVVVTGTEILVGGKVVASVADALGVDSDLIQPLKAELDI